MLNLQTTTLYQNAIYNQIGCSFTVLMGKTLSSLQSVLGATQTYSNFHVRCMRRKLLIGEPP